MQGGIITTLKSWLLF